MGSNEIQSTEQRSSNKTTEVLPMEPERRNVRVVTMQAHILRIQSQFLTRPQNQDIWN